MCKIEARWHFLRRVCRNQGAFAESKARLQKVRRNGGNKGAMAWGKAQWRKVRRVCRSQGALAGIKARLSKARFLGSEARFYRVVFMDVIVQTRLSFHAKARFFFFCSVLFFQGLLSFQQAKRASVRGGVPRARA